MDDKIFKRVKFTSEQKLEYYIQRLDIMNNSINPLLLIDYYFYRYDKTIRKYIKRKVGESTTTTINREDIINKLEYQIMIITRKKKIEIIKSRLNNE